MDGEPTNGELPNGATTSEETADGDATSEETADGATKSEAVREGTPMEEIVRARGHENVSAEHASTFEVTTDDYLTPAGDCILGVEADRAPADFDPEFVAACQSADATITARFEVSRGGGTEHCETVTGRGDPALSFESDRSAVGRTSDYVDDRTVLVGAAFAAEGFDRELVAALADGAELTLTLAVE